MLLPVIFALWHGVWVISNGGFFVLVYGFDSLLIGWDNGDFDVLIPVYNYATLWKPLIKNKCILPCFASCKYRL